MESCGIFSMEKSVCHDDRRQFYYCDLESVYRNYFLQIYFFDVIL